MFLPILVLYGYKTGLREKISPDCLYITKFIRIFAAVESLIIIDYGRNNNSTTKDQPAAKGEDGSRQERLGTSDKRGKESS